MQGGFDRRKCLQELEQEDWGEPPYDSYLITTVHQLRRKPLSEFTVEDLRIMTGQGIGLPFLIPLAVEYLENEPLVGGDFYPGDLLRAVLGVVEPFWADHPDPFQRLRKVVRRVKDMLPSLDEAGRRTVVEVMAEAPRWME